MTDRELFQKLADDLELSDEEGYGWAEDPDDRKVTITDESLTIKCTFEHDDDRGGQKRKSTTFTVEDGKLVANRWDNCELGDLKKLQAFVNDTVSYHDG